MAERTRAQSSTERQMGPILSMVQPRAMAPPRGRGGGKGAGGRGADGEADAAGGGGGGGAGGGAARALVGVPGVAGAGAVLLAAPEVSLGEGAEGGLGDEDGASGIEALDDGGVGGEGLG